MNTNQPLESTWIKKVQEESWQAELLVSGAVIIALFYAPGFIVRILESLIYRTDPYFATFIEMFSMFVLTGVYILIILLVIHFVLRAWWVAMLGLDFVYPHGIGDKPYMTVTKGILERYKRDYNTPKDEIKRLDDIGSLLFSVILTFVMIYIVISFWVLMVGLVLKIIHSFYPAIESYTFYLLLFLYALICIPMIKSYVDKKRKDERQEERDEKTYKMMKVYNKTMYLLFHRPVTYTMMMIFSNAKKNKFLGLLFVGIMTMGSIFASIHLNGYSFIGDINRDSYFDDMVNVAYMDKQLYRNKSTVRYPLHPSIQSDVINDDFVKLFVPIVKRDVKTLEKKGIPMSIASSNPSLDSLMNVRMKGYKEYVSIKLNGNTVAHPEVFRTKLDGTNARGLFYYIPSEELKNGKNKIIVEKNIFSKDSMKYKAVIPFMKGTR